MAEKKLKKSEAKQMVDTWDSMKPGPEKNRFWDKLVPYLNTYPELWKSGPRLRTEKGEKDG